MGISIEPTAKKKMFHAEHERTKLLKMPDGSVSPDPLVLTKEWLRELDGITSWPSIFLSDITVFLKAYHPGKDVEFKEEKPSRLFELGWLKEV